MPSSPKPSPSASIATFTSLGKHLTQLGVIHIFVHVIDANMPVEIASALFSLTPRAVRDRENITSAGYLAWDICVPFQGRKDICSPVIHGLSHGESSRSSS